MASDEVKKQITEILERSEYVADWPEDERELYRREGWPSFTKRNEALIALRVDKIIALALAEHPYSFEWAVWIADHPEYGIDTFDTEEEALASARKNKHWASTWPRTVASRTVYRPTEWTIHGTYTQED